MRVLASLLLALSVALAVAHPIAKFNFPTKALPKLLEAAKELELYKKSLDADGKYSCCIKAPKGSATPGCNMCAAKNGSCACAANLAAGKGTCGECKGGWVEGHGEMPKKALGVKSADDIKVLPSEHQKKAGVVQDPENPHLKKYKALMLEAKKIMVGEKRFNCCVGQGGCDECAMEGYCGCAINLNEDLKKKPGEKKDGVCSQCLDGQHGGHGRIPGADPNEIALMQMEMSMPGAITNAMAQEGSGTSWLPGASPMYMKMLPKSGRYEVSFMGLATLNYADAGGPRGESQLFTNSMAMLMAQRETGGTRVQLRGMLSLDAVTNGKQGYPNLFQTGETANGLPLQDRQHPHDLFMELAATLSRPIGKDARAFLYLAPIGEPALGTSAFQHRPSAWDNPEAPINHHWNDGTHITYGVVTAGVNVGGKLKIDASIFNGSEPNENRYDFDPIRLNSYSGRLTYNPNPSWSFSAAYGYLKSPEALEPGEDQHRITAAAFHNSALAGGNLSLGLIFGRNIKSGHSSDAWSLEGAWTRGKDVWFGRWERADKDELVNVPAGSYRVNKFTLGYTRDFASRDGFDYGLGGFVGFHSFPGSLESFYGRSPLSLGVFLRVRPSKS